MAYVLNPNAGEGGSYEWVDDAPSTPEKREDPLVELLRSGWQERTGAAYEQAPQMVADLRAQGLKDDAIRNRISQAIAKQKATGQGWTQWSTTTGVREHYLGLPESGRHASEQAGMVAAHREANKPEKSGLGGLAAIAAIVSSFIAPQITPFLRGASAAVSIAEGGNPITAVLSAAANSLFSGVGGLETGADAANSLAMEEFGGTAGTDFSLAGEAPTQVAGQVFDVPEPQSGIIGSTLPGGHTGEGFPDMSGDMGGGVTKTLAQRFSEGFGKILDDPKALATAGVGGAGLIFGAMKGIGDREAANELMEKQVQGRKEIDAAAADSRLREREAIRQGNVVPTGNMPVSSVRGAVLRRPDGTPVFGAGGIINNAMRA